MPHILQRKAFDILQSIIILVYFYRKYEFVYLFNVFFVVVVIAFFVYTYRVSFYVVLMHYNLYDYTYIILYIRVK